MKKTQLRNIIRKSIKEIMEEKLELQEKETLGPCPESSKSCSSDADCESGGPRAHCDGAGCCSHAARSVAGKKPSKKSINEKFWWNYHKCKCEGTMMMPDGNTENYKMCCGGSGAPCSSRWDCPKSKKGGMLANPSDKTPSVNKDNTLLREFFACECGLYGGPAGTEICLNTSGGCQTCCDNASVGFAGNDLEPTDMIKTNSRDRDIRKTSMDMLKRNKYFR